MLEVATKSQFADVTGVTRGRVSQWIAEGKLSGPALVGTGNRAKIEVAAALDQLKRNLDISQHLGANGKARLGGSDSEVTGTIEEEIKRARLEQLALANEKSREEAASRSGRYALAAAVTQQMGRVASQMVTMFDTALAEIATVTAARFTLNQRDVLHLMRTEFRAICTRAAVARREVAEALPVVVEDEPPAESDTA